MEIYVEIYVEWLVHLQGTNLGQARAHTLATRRAAIEVGR